MIDLVNETIKYFNLGIQTSKSCTDDQCTYADRLAYLACTCSMRPDASALCRVPLTTRELESTQICVMFCLRSPLQTVAALQLPIVDTALRPTED